MRAGVWRKRPGACPAGERPIEVRYVALNPVRAGLVARAADWPWSSARTHMAGREDGVASVTPVLDRLGDFAAYPDVAEDAPAVAAIRRSRSTGRPVGAAALLTTLEARPASEVKPGAGGRGRQREAI